MDFWGRMFKLGHWEGLHPWGVTMKHPPPPRRPAPVFSLIFIFTTFEMCSLYYLYRYYSLICISSQRCQQKQRDSAQNKGNVQRIATNHRLTLRARVLASGMGGHSCVDVCRMCRTYTCEYEMYPFPFRYPGLHTYRGMELLLAEKDWTWCCQRAENAGTLRIHVFTHNKKN